MSANAGHLRAVRDDPAAERLAALAASVVAFCDLIDQRHQAGWLKTPRPDVDRLRADAMNALHDLENT